MASRPRRTEAQGNADDVILATAAEVGADLIVVGSKGMQGARRYLGSVPNSVAHGARLRRAGGQDRLTPTAAARGPSAGLAQCPCRRTTSPGTIAENYDRDSSAMFDPAVVGARRWTSWPTLAGDGAALELGIGTGRIALPLVGARRAGAGDRPVARHGGPAAGEARCGGHRRDHRRLRHDRGAGEPSGWPTSSTTRSGT